MNENFISEAKDLQNEMVYHRRELHKIPELNLNLPQTAGYIKKTLDKLGIPFKECRECSGISALIKGKLPGKTIALRSDMDGLPIHEETDLSFASHNGNMHACGHDAHMAMLLGAASILSRMRSKLKGNVKLLFQPGEESDGGARLMIDDGVLKNPDVGAIIGQHTGILYPGLKTGQIGILPGPFMASQDHFTARIIGKGCHGAIPAEGIDPIVITAQVITALQGLISREINGTDSAVLTVGRIQGGQVYNIIPDFVEIEGTVRTLSPKIRSNIRQRIEEVLSGITKASRAAFSLDFIEGFPVLINDPDFTSFFYSSVSGIFEEGTVVKLDKPLMGSEDMAFFLQKVPGTFFFLSARPGNTFFPHHNSKFMLDEDVFWIGTAALVQGAVDWLNTD